MSRRHWISPEQMEATPEERAHVRAAWERDRAAEGWENARDEVERLHGALIDERMRRMKTEAIMAFVACLAVLGWTCFIVHWFYHR